ncbi:hypothetical protein FA95DRAFT_1402098 [Auriscalpium vulgare]|uniref:Uncharacterized protein n=1 Tax=Auriscalpium vulgare TaxID=40419 RepID=A0ACB8RQX5_9AGAM|nr:hypothetical protein FA95DRAFT_1402098 [Auriscalpium vulgare]
MFKRSSPPMSPPMSSVARTYATCDLANSFMRKARRGMRFNGRGLREITERGAAGSFLAPNLDLRRTCAAEGDLGPAVRRVRPAALHGCVRIDTAQSVIFSFSFSGPRNSVCFAERQADRLRASRFAFPAAQAASPRGRPASLYLTPVNTCPTTGWYIYPSCAPFVLSPVGPPHDPRQHEVHVRPRCPRRLCRARRRAVLVRRALWHFQHLPVHPQLPGHRDFAGRLLIFHGFAVRMHQHRVPDGCGDVPAAELHGRRPKRCAPAAAIAVRLHLLRVDRPRLCHVRTILVLRQVLDSLVRQVLDLVASVLLDGPRVVRAIEPQQRGIQRGQHLAERGCQGVDRRRRVGHRRGCHRGRARWRCARRVNALQTCARARGSLFRFDRRVLMRRRLV